MAAQLNEAIQYTDPLTNALLVAGKIFIGVSGQDPVLNPTPIFSDPSLDVAFALANPQTIGADGRSENKIYIPAQYSIRVNDSLGNQQFQDLTAGSAAAGGITGLTNIQGTNAITAEGVPAITGYVDKEQYPLTIVNENTDSVTINIDGKGVKNIRRNFDQTIVKGQFKQNMVVILTFNESADVMEWTNQNLKVEFNNKGANIASAATVDLSLATGNSVTVTGSTGPITSFGITPAGSKFWIVFASTPTINHNATSNKIDGQANITMVAGDRILVESLGSGNNQITVFRQTGGSLNILAATQAEQETGTSLLKTVTPGRQQFHQSAAKAWVFYNQTVPSIGASYNVSSVTDNSAGNFTVNFSIAFSTVNFISVGITGLVSANNGNLRIVSGTVGSSTFLSYQTFNNNSGDSTSNLCAFFGDQ